MSVMEVQRYKLLKSVKGPGRVELLSFKFRH